MRGVSIVALVLAAAGFALPAAAEAQTKRKGDRTHITADDLAETPSGMHSAHDAIRLLRPNWLNPTMSHTSSSNVLGNGGGASEVICYIDDVRQPSLEELKTVKLSQVVSMRFLEQNAAVALRGPGHELGAIEVTTVNKRK